MYLGHCQTSMMEFFFKNSFKLFSQKVFIRNVCQSPRYASTNIKQSYFTFSLILWTQETNAYVLQVNYHYKANAISNEPVKGQIYYWAFSPLMLLLFWIKILLQGVTPLSHDKNVPPQDTILDIQKMKLLFYDINSYLNNLAALC